VISAADCMFSHKLRQIKSFSSLSQCFRRKLISQNLREDVVVLFIGRSSVVYLHFRQKTLFLSSPRVGQDRNCQLENVNIHHETSSIKLDCFTNDERTLRKNGTGREQLNSPAQKSKILRKVKERFKVFHYPHFFIPFFIPFVDYNVTTVITCLKTDNWGKFIKLINDVIHPVIMESLRSVRCGKNSRQELSQGLSGKLVNVLFRYGHQWYRYCIITQLSILQCFIFCMFGCSGCFGELTLERRGKSASWLLHSEGKVGPDHPQCSYSTQLSTVMTLLVPPAFLPPRHPVQLLQLMHSDLNCLCMYCNRIDNLCKPYQLFHFRYFRHYLYINLFRVYAFRNRNRKSIVICLTYERGVYVAVQSSV
jgi:hypothetical protein